MKSQFLPFSMLAANIYLQFRCFKKVYYERTATQPDIYAGFEYATRQQIHKYILNIYYDLNPFRSITQKPLKWFQEQRAIFDKHDETSGQSKV
jgi:hypothetical protein